ILAITATLGTHHRPRTDTRPTQHVGTPCPEEAP
ncbi:cupin domain-containing protein, partial [Streptomyces sp. NEAU-H22]|nr:cupin domain-containing protein [Streptomyces sp. NEAU-H22]